MNAGDWITLVVVIVWLATPFTLEAILARKQKRIDDAAKARLNWHGMLRARYGERSFNAPMVARDFAIDVKLARSILIDESSRGRILFETFRNEDGAVCVRFAA